MSFDEQYKKEKCLWGTEPTPIVKSLLKHKKTGNALDIGSGEGRNSIFLARNGFDVTAVDVSKNGIEKLKEISNKEKLKINANIEDIRNFDFNQSYDVIISIATLHFLKIGDIVKMISKIKKYTKKGGLNAISVFTDENDEKGFPYLFKKEELKKFYKDWEILFEREFIGPLEKHGDNGKWHKHAVAVIIARK